MGFPTPLDLDVPECDATVVDIKVQGDIYLLYVLAESNAESVDGSGLGVYFLQKRLSNGDLDWEYQIPGTGNSNSFTLQGGFFTPKRIDCDGSQVYVVGSISTQVGQTGIPDHFFAVDASTGLKVWGRNDLPADLRDVECGGSGVYVACGIYQFGACNPTTDEAAFLSGAAIPGWNVAEYLQTGVFVRAFGVMPEASAVLFSGGKVWVGSRHGTTICFCEDGRVEIGGCICRYSITGELELVCAGGEWNETIPGLKRQTPLLWGYVNRLVESPAGDIVSAHRIERPEDCFFFELDSTYGFLKGSKDLTGRDPPISAFIVESLAFAGGTMFATAGGLLYHNSGTAQRNRGYLTQSNSTYNRTGSYVALDSDGSDLVAGGSSAGCTLDDKETPYLVIECNASQPRLCGDFNTRGQAIVGCGPEDGVEPTCAAYLNTSFAGCLANMQASIALTYNGASSGPCPDSTHYWSGTINPFVSQPFPETSVDCEELISGVGTGNFSPCCISFSGGSAEVCYNCQEDTWVVKFTITGTSNGFGGPFTMVFYATIQEQFCNPPSFTFTWDGTYISTGTGDQALTTCCAGMTGCGGFITEEGCEGVSVCCPIPLPTTLTATLSAAGCAALHGQTVSLNYQGLSGGAHFWEGNFTPSTACGEMTFKFVVLDGIGCQYSMCLVQVSTSTVVWGSCNAGGSDTITCPFTSASYTEPIPLCAGAMDCVGDLTALVA